MEKTAFLFPGQGSQKVGMGREIYQRSNKAKEIFELANASLGFSLSEIMFNGPEQELVKTEFAQPAILTHSIAALETAREEGFFAPEFVGGHSLGEYSALVAAGTISFHDAVKAVHLRGRYMQDAVPFGVGAMAAVLGLDSTTIEECCAEITKESEDFCVEVANFNGPDQTVISGTAQGIEKAIGLVKEKGAKRAIPLSVSAPFHCRLMKPAADKLARHLATVEFHAPKIAFINNVEADLESDPIQIRDLLVKQVTAPVRFTAMLTKLGALGVNNFVEIGPGKVLSGIVRRTLSDVTVTSKET